MPITFSCPHCNRRLSVPSKRANTTAVCPKCQEQLTVPEKPRTTPSKQKKKTADAKAPAAANPFSEFEVFDLPPNEASKVAHQQKLSRSRQLESQPINPATLAVPRHVLYLQGGLLLVLAVTAFSLGLLVGQQGGLQDDQGAAGLQPAVITGKVTYVSEDGLTISDDDCSIFLLPRETFPTTKVAVEELQPTKPGLEEIKRIGGAYSQADVKGEFRINLPAGGRFALLAISANRKRTRDISAEDLAGIGTYFESTRELLGDREYRWSTEVIRDNREFAIKFQ
jgi:hypothetical protein